MKLVQCRSNARHPIAFSTTAVKCGIRDEVSLDGMGICEYFEKKDE